MELYLIRHTSVDVDKGICYGASDVPVAESFNTEALQIADEITELNFDIIWSSPLSRCKKLANFLFPNTGINVHKNLTELNFGDWENKTWDYIFSLPEGKAWMDNFVNIKCPNGESFQDQIKRTEEFYKKEIKNKEYKKVALIVHSGIIRSFQCLFENVQPQNAFNQNIDYGQVVKISL